MKKRTPLQRHNDKLLDATVRKHLQEQFSNGLKQGVYATCKVVKDKAMAEGKTEQERLNDILAFVDSFCPTLAVAAKKQEE